MSSPQALPAVYIERQSRFRCGLHAINALLKRSEYTPQALDTIADALRDNHPSPISRFTHPHRSIFGLGNYDLNVLQLALERKGLEATWLSPKHHLKTLLKQPNLVGFLVNVRATTFLATVFSALFDDCRHWIAVARYADAFYLVDSMRRQPHCFASASHLHRYFDTIRQQQQAHILFVEHHSQSSTSS
ncbi:Josephin-like protein [Gracilariopsis chorda]|uniref:ubiquitinyl hydrolase 1 n=1 Tax=Gracilariopsis chorda TaxID=448386 RepID=A0A2V3INZ8_9FLOR|nr:Josephin-like protein [Gracilariopsis chorda]|eukprot:PXF43811.1 Josephin-like protein [Gracilariopsis chorda]